MNGLSELERVHINGDSIKTYAPPVWPLYPYDEVQGFGDWPLYPFGENWSGWDLVQPVHVHQWIDITAIDDPKFKTMCGVCGEIRIEDK